MKLSRRKKRYVRLGVILGLLGVLFVLGLTRFNRWQSPLLGVTFSHTYASQLGIDWREAYAATLKDLGPDHLRIPVYWSSLEPAKDEFHFEHYDWMLDEAAKEGTVVTLAVGQKVPRWPECFIPDWMDSYNEADRQEHALDMLEAVVTRYNNHPAIARWQVENEVFLQFGSCPKPDLGFFRQELDLVRSLSDKPIAMTTSGEIEPWFHTAPFADQVGFSMYRLTWSPVFGFWIYPLQPNFYRARVKALQPFVDEVYVSELQAEPWFHAPIDTLSIEDQHQMFSPRMLRENVRFARRIGTPLIDLWGVEWWWYMRENGDSSLWDEAKRIF